MKSFIFIPVFILILSFPLTAQLRVLTDTAEYIGYQLNSPADRLILLSEQGDTVCLRFEEITRQYKLKTFFRLNDYYRYETHVRRITDSSFVIDEYFDDSHEIMKRDLIHTKILRTDYEYGMLGVSLTSDGNILLNAGYHYGRVFGIRAEIGNGGQLDLLASLIKQDELELNISFGIGARNNRGSTCNNSNRYERHELLFYLAPGIDINYRNLYAGAGVTFSAGRDGPDGTFLSVGYVYRFN